MDARAVAVVDDVDLLVGVGEVGARDARGVGAVVEAILLEARPVHEALLSTRERAEHAGQVRAAKAVQV